MFEMTLNQFTSLTNGHSMGDQLQQSQQRPTWCLNVGVMVADVIDSHNLDNYQ